MRRQPCHFEAKLSAQNSRRGKKSEAVFRKRDYNVSWLEICGASDRNKELRRDFDFKLDVTKKCGWQLGSCRWKPGPGPEDVRDFLNDYDDDCQTIFVSYELGL